MLGFPVHHQLLELTQTHVHLGADAIQPSHPLPSPSPPAPNPSQHKVFSNESTLHMRWPKYWSFSFSISPCNEHLGLISFMMGWMDLLAAQGILKSLLKHHSSKAPILQHLDFFHRRGLEFGFGVQNETGQRLKRVLPREHTGHNKHPLPTTQETTLHMDITRWSKH